MWRMPSSENSGRSTRKAAGEDPTLSPRPNDKGFKGDFGRHAFLVTDPQIKIAKKYRIMALETDWAPFDG